MSEGYRGPQVCKYVGITYRQLDYWARSGLLEPSVKGAVGSGSQRLYSFQDLVLLRTIKRLRDAGMSLQRVREAIDYVRNDLDGDLADVTLISDGKTIIAARGDQQLIDALRGGQITFAVALGSVYDDLGEVSELHPDRGVEAEPAQATDLRHPSQSVTMAATADSSRSLGGG